MLVASVCSTETEVMSLPSVLCFISLNGWAACCNEIQLNVRQENYVSICCNSQAALKAPQAAETTSPFVRQYQKALNDMSTRHTVGLYWVHRHAGVWGNEIADKLARDSSNQKFVGPEPSLRVSRQSIRRKIKCWMNNQHLARWWGLSSTQRLAWELITLPSQAAKTSLLSFNRIQSRVVTGLLAGHNTLRRHLHLMGLTSSPLCRRCGAEDETLAHILCECESLASLRHVHLGCFFLDPEDIMSLSLGVIWDFSKGIGLPWTGIRLWGTWGPFLRPRCIGTIMVQT